jgi:hypothetical protein
MVTSKTTPAVAIPHSVRATKMPLFPSFGHSDIALYFLAGSFSRKFIFQKIGFKTLTQYKLFF